MGYYTKHELEIIDGDDFKTNYEEEISQYADYGNCFGDSIKWYGCESDMIDFSKKYPKTTFCVNGFGEEHDDIWKAYFKNGKMFKTKAEFVFEEFNESKLK